MLDVGRNTFEHSTNMKLSIRILLFTSLLFFSCVTKQKRVSGQDFDPIISPQDADTSDLYYKDIKVWKTWLNLSDTQKSNLSIEFRIWCSPELRIKKQLIQLRKSNGLWKAKLYSFDIRSTKLENSKELTPKSNWTNIENRLIEFNIGQLPDDAKVPAELLYDDGISFIAEIFDAKSYRYTKFSNPHLIAKRNKEANYWDALLTFIFDEFGISY